ncbi:metallophosphoesterase family protein [Bifidobacterium sp. 82T24]|uniref:metallophosphoesterase family protein n=1 Tax=Bifidobacterium pluvialisilvae TaxID=2834436 RepID=UPI001C575151|nr:metallophosphoesterase family protein [Bifidobacterium pluvialisilvae]MBW3089108.1 metallophosphoesterase family protein [Bifidobacterium pluvialisilvae]
MSDRIHRGASDAGRALSHVGEHVSERTQRILDAVEEERPVSVSAKLGRLQFHRSGKFRILQFTDIQDGPKVSKDTIRLIEAACDAGRPDVVVFTGDQIAGYDSAYAKTSRKRRWDVPKNGGPDAADLDHTRDLVRKSIRQFVQPLIDRNVPFAVTFGNHDFQCGLDNAELNDIYREFPGCLNPPMAAAEQPGAAVSAAYSGLADQEVYACEPGTFALPVTDMDHKRNVIGLVIVDSGDYAKSGGYDSPSQRALDFLDAMPSVLDAKSIVFQHIPIPQFYDVLKPVSSSTAYAIQGYRSFDAACYVLDESKTLPGSYLGEGVSCPDVDCGEFQIMKDTDGYFGLFAGHDHRNGFVGTTEGIMLGATPTCGFGAYGPVPDKRAARLFEFDIRHPYEPRTQLLEFGQIVGKPTTRKAYTFAMSHVPTNPGDAWNLLRKPGAMATIAAGFAAAVASLGFTGKRR